MVDIGGYVIVLVEQNNKIKLYGSPADQKDCDEILEINNKPLDDDMNHQEILDYIHQCIKSRTICLRVKRRNSDKLALNSSPIDAFIIGNRAREHFEKIIQTESFRCVQPGKSEFDSSSEFISNVSSTSIITPKDIAQLSKLLNENNASGSNGDDDEELLNVSRSSSSAATTAAAAHKQSPSSKNYPGAISGETTVTTATSLPHHESLSQTSSSTLSNTRDSNFSNSDFIVITSSSSKCSNSLVSVTNNSSFKYGKLESGCSISSDSNQINATDDSSLGTSKTVTTETTDNNISSESTRATTTTAAITSGSSELSSKSNMELVELNSHGAFQIHRELPVDVPDSFVGVVKQTPRYPPPHLPSHAPPPIPSQRYSSTLSDQQNNNFNHQQQQQRYNLDQEKIRKYSDEIHRKKEEEEFLRSSIRNSKKLQQLQEHKANHVEPMVNIAFEPDDDQVIMAYNNNTYAGGPATAMAAYNAPVSAIAVNKTNERESDKVLPLPYLEEIVYSIRNNVNSDLKDLIDKSKLQNLVSVYSTLMKHQQSKTNSFIDSQQTLRPPSYNSITRQNNIQNSSDLNSSNYSSYTNGGGASTSSNPESSELLQDAIGFLQHNMLHSDAVELLGILTKFEVEELCHAYDRVVVDSNKNMLSLVSDELVHDDKAHEIEMLETMHSPGVKVVQIEKTSCEPLGATVRNEADGSVIIGRIIKGGAAHKSGMLHEGDEILEVNGIEMKGRNVNQVCDLLSEMTGTLTFVIAIRDNLIIATSPQLVPQHQQPPNQVLHLRTLFDYDPDEDLYIPCRELGICFNKGDILHVIDQSDVNWWQAYREGDEHDQSLAGLIPSIQFQLQREAMKQSILNDSNVNTSTLNRKNRYVNGKSKSSSLLFNCGKHSLERKKKKNSKHQRFIGAHEEILTYEEVFYYYPRPNFKRPIVLIGPTNIGRHELRQRLMQDTERFSAAVPHTSRPRKDGEMDGIDYHFISRQMFEHDIKEGRFVEHGEYEKNYYGTSFAAIEAVVQSSKICILNLHVHSIPLLRQGQAGAKLKPFFVFVAPPTQPENLHRLLTLKSTGRNGEATSFTMAEYQSIIDEAAEIEAKFGHYFDMVLQMTDIESAYHELLSEINALEHEPQWIPSTWVK